MEFVKNAKSKCISPIGQLTGLEPVTSYVQWYPIDGTSASILTQYPGILSAIILNQCNYSFCNDSGNHTIPNDYVTQFCSRIFEPVAFEPNSNAEMNETLCMVWKKWPVGDPIRNIWKHWVIYQSPVDHTAEQFVAKYGLHVPLEYCFHSNFYVQEPGWIFSNNMQSETAVHASTEFQWPNILAACLPSVETSRNRNPPPPRIYIPTNTELVALRKRFDDITPNYYSIYLKTRLNNDQLKQILKHRINPHGQNGKLTGSKKELIQRIHESDLEIITLKYRPILPTDYQAVMNVLTGAIVSIDDPYKVLTNVILLMLYIYILVNKLTMMNRLYQQYSSNSSSTQLILKHYEGSKLEK